MENITDAIITNKTDAINKLNTYLDSLINSTSEADRKKANLLSYWIKDYTNYIKTENQYVAQKQLNYKRGNVVQANLGFNIGSEQGGLHYCIVINSPSKSSNTITVIPLTSLKNSNKNLHSSEVLLGKVIIDSICDKLNYLINNLKDLQKNANNSNSNSYITKEIRSTEKFLYSLNKMKKCDSIALVGNITTISKQRIYTPTLSNGFLKNISISNEHLDMLDSKIIELYTKNK